MTLITETLDELQIYFKLRREWERLEARKYELERILGEYEQKHSKILRAIEDIQDAPKLD